MILEFFTNLNFSLILYPKLLPKERFWAVLGQNTSRCKFCHIWEKAAKVASARIWKSGVRAWDHCTGPGVPLPREAALGQTGWCGGVNMGRKHQTDDCLVGWKYWWCLQKGWEFPRAAELHPLCALCCSWVRSFLLPLPLCFCGKVTSLPSNRTRAEQTVIISFPGQVSITECNTGVVLRLFKATNTGLMKDSQPPMDKGLLCFCLAAQTSTYK